MLNRSRILIAEDEAFTAMDMVFAVEDANGQVLGPVARVSDGLGLAAREHIHAAILDVNLLDGDITLLAQALLDNSVIVLFHTASSVPESISGHAGVCKKPMHPADVVRTLAGHLNRR
jgi:DNA-binding response OmpR family regulator